MNSRIEPVDVKEASSLLDRVRLFSIQNGKEMEAYNMQFKLLYTWLKALLFVQRNKHQF